MAASPRPVLDGVDHLARAQRFGDVAILGGHEGGRGRGVGIGEVDLLLAVVGDRHAVHDDVELAGLETGDHAVPVLRDDLALDAGPLAQVVGEIGLEADDMAARVGQVVGIVGPLHPDDDGLPLFGERRRNRQRRRDASAERRRFPEFHAHPTFSLSRYAFMRPAADLPGSNDSLTFGFKGWECGPAPKVCAAMTQPERRGTQASPARRALERRSGVTPPL